MTIVSLRCKWPAVSQIKLNVSFAPRALGYASFPGGVIGDVLKSQGPAPHGEGVDGSMSELIVTSAATMGDACMSVEPRDGAMGLAASALLGDSIDTVLYNAPVGRPKAEGDQPSDIGVLPNESLAEAGVTRPLSLADATESQDALLCAAGTRCGANGHAVSLHAVVAALLGVMTDCGLRAPSSVPIADASAGVPEGAAACVYVASCTAAAR